ncbi:RNA polymerase sigma factor [Planomicrobium sp. CPCC 101079]|uniref:RNA polymerase sigma factor n=1 Tax=Planomicrobium sp. CPCC 101079 TaxID=2599618 RepID=UPI0011B5617A|nr:sigma-70 family RNA polymerase sigma factor [Planomicrobium sp. CPCC 101079]TWT13175.1 sigma-70 family RNA polymerase sigma factor [Planomicrobium sp. CPCC 101079]
MDKNRTSGLQPLEVEHILLSKLMNEHGPELKRIAFLYINDITESEDIVQEVFISCYQHLASFRNEADYKTWLIRITINKCKDHRRLWGIRNLVYRPIHQLVKKNESAEATHLDQQFSSELIEQISKLSSKYKEVLILYYYLELTMQEISEVLEISINTVKSRLLRGKKSLKTRLGRSEQHGQV